MTSRQKLADIRYLINEIYDDETDEYRLASRDCFRQYCTDIDEELKVLEIIKKYPRCTLQRYIGFIDAVKQGYITKWEELTQELLYNYDFDCSVEEFNVIKEWLNNLWQF